MGCNGKRFMWVCECFLPYVGYLCAAQLVQWLTDTAVSRLNRYPCEPEYTSMFAVLFLDSIYLPILLLEMKREGRLRTEFSLYPLKNKRLFLWILLVVCVCLLSAVVTLIAAKADISVGGDYMSAQAMYRSNLPLTVLVCATVAPMLEEILFRGFLYQRLRSVAGRACSAVISSLCFAVGHPSVLQILYALFMGILFVYLYEREKTLLLPIVMHSAANIAAILISAAMIKA